MNRSLLAIQDRLNILCAGQAGGFTDASFAGYSGVTRELNNLVYVELQNYHRRSNSRFSDGQEQKPLILCGLTISQISRDSGAYEYEIFYKNHDNSVRIKIEINYFTKPFIASGYLYTPRGDKGQPIHKYIRDLDDLRKFMDTMFSRDD
jgi:hypothetical protein